MLKILIKISRFIFGNFEEPEFKKFTYMGLIFGFIIGTYWTLKQLKDSIFILLVDKMDLPYAKTISVIALLPLLIAYTKLLEKTSREKMLMIVPAFYGVAIAIFTVLIYIAREHMGSIQNSGLITFIFIKTIGYLWYFLVESFGSITPALFWAYAADTTRPESAKRGFPLVIAIGQSCSTICPYAIAGLPYRLGLETDTLSLIIVTVLILAIIPLVKHFLKITPKNLLMSFHGRNEQEEEAKQEPGFLEGLKLIFSNPYLMGILFAICAYELIITIFDFNFKVAAATQYSGVALTNYLSIYGSCVGAFSLIILLLGISNITRFLGVGIALTVTPIAIGAALLGFLNIDSLNFLFALMVGSKAINYALNGPSLKQLYIPTTKDVRFKAEAWIETFGARASKEIGAVINMLLKPLQNIFGTMAGKAYYIFITGFIGVPLIMAWFVIAIYLGKKYKTAITENKVIC
jgi:AAA family ATP:ADP antiporter